MERKEIFDFINFKGPPDCGFNVFQGDSESDRFLHGKLFCGKIHIKLYSAATFERKTRMLQAFYIPGKREAGCDEAGRGCLAGPVFAAAVILPEDFGHDLLQDSKKLSGRQRMEAAQIVRENAVAWAVARAEVEEIDAINILNASFLAMHRAIAALDHSPEVLLIDGNRFHPYEHLPFSCMVKGDGRFSAIAAASILAKTERDAWMLRLASQYPQYGWEKNKGYPTEAHRKAIAIHGPSPFHRMTFRLLPDNPQGVLFD